MSVWNCHIAIDDGIDYGINNGIDDDVEYDDTNCIHVQYTVQNVTSDSKC
jgi:hypothetical protein